VDKIRAADCQWISRGELGVENQKELDVAMTVMLEEGLRKKREGGGNPTKRFMCYWRGMC